MLADIPPQMASYPIMLKLQNLSVGRAGRPVARVKDADVPAGAAALLLGASGSGKSTLLFTLAGLLAPISGAGLLDLGRRGHRRRGRRGDPTTALSIVLERLEVLLLRSFFSSFVGE